MAETLLQQHPHANSNEGLRPLMSTSQPPSVPLPQTLAQCPITSPPAANLNFDDLLLLFPGYLRPPSSSPLDPALSVLCDVLSSGRTSRLFKRLVVPGKLLSVDAAESFPGDQMTTLLLLYGIPTPGTASQLRIIFLFYFFLAQMTSSLASACTLSLACRNSHLWHFVPHFGPPLLAGLLKPFLEWLRYGPVRQPQRR